MKPPIISPHLSRSTYGMVVVLGVVLEVSAAFGNTNGIVGRSGRQGSTCIECHGGGVAPDVEFEAPSGSRMEPGAIATFRFKITSNEPDDQTHAGFDVAPSGGTIGVTDPAGTKKLAAIPDITHAMPRANDANGVAAFEFTWQAPATPGTYTLFGAGNSVNFDFGSGGDQSAAATLLIDVVAAATATPPPTDTPVPTPTATRQPGGPCTGDCDGGGSVTVDEIVRGVNIGLGSRPVDDCPAFDPDSNGSVTVDEIVEAIGNALEGCD